MEDEVFPDGTEADSRIPYETARTSMLELAGDPSAQAATIDDYVFRLQQHTKKRSYSDGNYLESQDRYEDSGMDMYADFLKSNAESMLFDLGAERGQQVWNAFTTGEAGDIDDESQKVLKSFEEFAIKHQPKFGQRIDIPITEAGAGENDLHRHLGGGRLSMRAGQENDFTITQSSRGISQGDVTFQLDSNLNAELARIEKSSADATDRLAEYDDDLAASQSLPYSQGLGLAREREHANDQELIMENTKKSGRYNLPNGMESYSRDQITNILQNDPRYQDSFGNRGPIALAGSVGRGLAKFGATIGGASTKIQSGLIGGAVETAGELTGNEDLADTGQLIQDAGAGVARDIATDTDEYLKENLLGMESSRFTQEFWPSVRSDIAEEIGPMAVQIAATGGSSYFGKKAIVSALASKPMKKAALTKAIAKLNKNGSLDYVDNIAAPLLGSSIGGVREAQMGWIEDMQRADGLQGLHVTTDDMRNAGLNDEADEVDKIRENANDVYALRYATVAGTDMFVMRRYLGKMGGKLIDQQAKHWTQKFGKFAYDKTVSGAAEAITEIGQEGMSDVWANQFYDDNRNMFPSNDELGRTAAVAGIMGIAADVALSSSSANKDAVAREESKAAMQKAVHTALLRAKEVTDATVENATEVGKFAASQPDAIPAPASEKVMDGVVQNLANNMTPMQATTAPAPVASTLQADLDQVDASNPVPAPLINQVVPVVEGDKTKHAVARADETTTLEFESVAEANEFAREQAKLQPKIVTADVNKAAADARTVGKEQSKARKDQIAKEEQRIKKPLKKTEKAWADAAEANNPAPDKAADVKPVNGKFNVPRIGGGNDFVFGSIEEANAYSEAQGQLTEAPKTAILNGLAKAARAKGKEEVTTRTKAIAADIKASKQSELDAIASANQAPAPAGQLPTQDQGRIELSDGVTLEEETNPLRIFEDRDSYILKDGDNQIGTINIATSKNPPDYTVPRIIDVKLDDSARGKGLARQALKNLINKYGVVASDHSGHTTPEAAAMWEAVGGRKTTSEDPVTAETEYIAYAEDLATDEEVAGTGADPVALVTETPDGKFAVKRADGTKTEVFGTTEEANAFSAAQDAIAPRIDPAEVKATAAKARETGKSQNKIRKEKVATEKLKLKEAERLRKEGAKTTKAADKTVAEEQEKRRKAAPKSMNKNAAKGKVAGFWDAAMDYLLFNNNVRDGVPLIENAFGLKTPAINTWATDNGKFAVGSPEYKAKLFSAMGQFALTGEGNGMELELGKLRRLMEPLYKRSIKQLKRIKVKRGETVTDAKQKKIDARDQTVRTFNTLFLDNIRRDKTSDLKLGEELAMRRGFVRIPTQKGEKQKGFKKEFHARTFYNNQRDPVGNRLAIEEQDGLYYITRPILTPDVASSLALVDSFNNLEGRSNADQPLALPPPSRKDISDTVAHRKGFSRLTLRNTLNAIPVLPSVPVNPEITVTAELLENGFVGDSQAIAESTSFPIDFEVDAAGRVENVKAKNGKDSTMWHDVLESIARGEDKYTMPETVRASMIMLRQWNKDLNKVAIDEGVDLKYYFNDPRLSVSENIDRSGIDGHFPLVVDMEATRANNPKLSDKQIATMLQPPAKKKGFEKHRDQTRTQEEKVKDGIVYMTPRGAMLNYGMDMRRKITENRFITDPAMSDKIDNTANFRNQTNLLGHNVTFDNRNAQRAFEDAVNTKPVDLGYIIGFTDRMNREIKTTLVGMDIGQLGVYGPMVAANSMEAYVKAQAISMKTFMDAKAFEKHLQYQDKLRTYADYARHGGNADLDVEFLIKREEDPLVHRALTALTKPVGRVIGLKNGLSPVSRAAEAFRAFNGMAALQLWEGMTAHLERNADGTLADSAAEQGRAITKTIGQMQGRLNFEREGYTARTSAVLRAAMFAPQLVAGSASLMANALTPSNGMGPKTARKALSKYIGGATFATGALMLAVGMHPDEVKRRLNPLSDTDKWMVVSVETPEGTIDFSIGGTILAITKVLRDSGRIHAGLSDDSWWHPYAEFVTNRKAPVIGFGISLFKGKNHWGEPISVAESIFDGISPLWSQTMMKKGIENLYDRDGRLWRDIGEDVRTNPYESGPMTFALLAISFVGFTGYSQREYSLIAADRDKVSRAKYGVPYDHIGNKEQQARVAMEVSNMPRWRAVDATIANTGARASVAKKTLERDNVKVSKQIHRALSTNVSTAILRAQMKEIPPLNRSYEYDGQMIRMSDEQFKRFKQEVTGNIENTVQNLLDDPDYAVSSSEWRIPRVQEAVSKAMKDAYLSSSWLRSPDDVRQRQPELAR